MWTGSLLPVGLALTGVVLVGLFLLDGSGTAPDREKDPDPLPGHQVARGLAIAPAPLDLEVTDRTLVGLGSYLVNALAGCGDCHSLPERWADDSSEPDLEAPFDRDPLLAGDAGLAGRGSSHLAPDPDGLPAGLTWPEFRDLMRTGTRPDGSSLKGMPWWVYRNMTTGDLRAIYEYLRAIPPVNAPSAAR